MKSFWHLFLILLALAIPPAGAAETAITGGAAYFAAEEAAGDLPPVAERLPEIPLVTVMPEIGRPGGELRTLMASPKDSRILVAYSYARLIGYDREFNLVADILKRFEVEEGRIFTFHLRPGHRWSNGKP